MVDPLFPRRSIIAIQTSASKSRTPRVLILGAGFGGLECAKYLRGKPVDVLIVDRVNYHQFTPLFYQVATALLAPTDIVYPIRALLRRASNVRFGLGEVTGVDLDGRKVRLADGRDLPYDYVVIATGSVTDFFGLPGVAESAFGLKDLHEAVALRSQIVGAFEAAAREPDPAERAAWLRFVVVGGGPTGVECAGAIAELIRRVMARDYPEIGPGEASISLVEARDRVFPTFFPHLSAHAHQRLRRLGVELYLNTWVVSADGQSVRLSDGETIPTRTIVWAAGVRGSDLATRLGLALRGAGRVPVDQTLRVIGKQNAFAIGDIASVLEGSGELPMIAQPAIQGGRYAAAAILGLETGRTPAPFRYRDKGVMATIGRHSAVAQVGRWSFKGVVGWAAWLGLHLWIIMGFRNRLAVLLSWAWNYFFYDRPTRLASVRDARRATRDE